MICELCKNGIEPDYVFHLNKEETKEKMKEQYGTLDHLYRHLKYGHNKKDIAKLLMTYIEKEEMIEL